MVDALLVCSDGGCATLYEARAPSGEVDALGCACGCWLQPLGWPLPAEDAGDRGELVLTPVA